MAYSKFTVSELKQQFGVKFVGANLFLNVIPIVPSDWLMESIKLGKETGFGNEKSRSERLVTPVLLELARMNEHSFSIHSGAHLNVDETIGLNGECDFIFSANRIQDFLIAPVFCITEAKKQDLEQGIIQASAQLIGAKKFNELDQNDIQTIYGASTTGLEWRFLKYENNVITIDFTRYLLTDLAKLLGILQAIVGEMKANKVI